MDESDAEIPPDEAYGRVTNPERYLVLHDAAFAEIDRLVTTYEIDRTDGVDLVPQASRFWPGAHAVLLTPAGGGAPITVTLTSFPGVAVHAGHAYDIEFPVCGCDACDEQPEDLVERLREVLADVTSGGLSETRQRRLLGSDRCTIRLVCGDRTDYTQSEGAFDRTEHGDLPIGTTCWPPWQQREWSASKRTTGTQ